MFVFLDTCHCAGYSKGDESLEPSSQEEETPPTTEETGADNVKCDTPPTQRRSLIEKVRERTETAKQRGKKWVHWLTPTTENDETAVTDETDNNNTDSKDPVVR